MDVSTGSVMNRQQAPLRIRLYQSKKMAFYRHLLHAVLMAYATVAAVSYPLAMLVPIICLTVSWYLLFQRIRTEADEQSTLVWRPDGSWLIGQGPRQSRRYRALASCFTSHWLTILGFREGLLGRRYYLLLADNCDPGQHRRLRVRLKQPISQRGPKVDNYPVSGQ